MREGEVMRAASAYRLRVKKRHRNAMAVVSVASPSQTRSFPAVLQVAFTFVLHHSDHGTFFPRLKYMYFYNNFLTYPFIYYSSN